MNLTKIYLAGSKQFIKKLDKIDLDQEQQKVKIKKILAKMHMLFMRVDN